MSDLSVAIVVAATIFTIGVVAMLRKRQPPPPQLIYQKGEPPSSIEKTIAETEAIIIMTTTATAHRKEAKWYYTQRFEDPNDGPLAVAHFKRPEGTPFRVGKSISGDTLIAVWRGDDPPTEEDEAELDKNLFPKPFKASIWHRIWERVWPW